MRKLITIGLFGLLLVPVITNSQVVYERHTHEVNQYLARMAQKGLIVWDDNIQPVRINQIKIALDSLQQHSVQLSVIEQKELQFYQSLYTPSKSKRDFSVESTDFSFRAFPVVSGELLHSDSLQYFKKSIGLNFYGSVAKRWGYQLSFQDISESGQLVDTAKQGIHSAGVTGYVKNSLFNNKSINYTEIRAHISYAFKQGVISLGQDYLLWGYGKGGRVVLGDKAPTYPYIRFDIQPISWLRFNYTHAWLKSDIPDSARSYSIPNGLWGGVREVMVSKFMAQHSLDIRIKKGLNLMLGESMLYTDRLNVGYFIPVLFFKAFDNYNGSGSITRGSNGQFFLQLSSRNQLKNTHLYGSLFIDEIKISKVLNAQQRRNQLGYTVGGTVTDLGLSYLTVGAEYTRIRPFVYRNFLPAQNYTSASYLLGDWMGANADRFYIMASYTPRPRLKCTLYYQRVQKGSEGTLQQQYFVQPQPAFLFGTKKTWNDLDAKVSYEWLPRLSTQVQLRLLNGHTQVITALSYGL